MEGLSDLGVALGQVKSLLRYWFTFEQAVDRAAFLRHGVALMIVKYGVDALLVGLGTGTVWTPLDYLQSVPLLTSSRFSDSAPYLVPALAAWTLPFLWIGVSMTIRRLLDAGWSAWWCLLFFVPVASYILMAVLALAPSSPGKARGDRLDPSGDRIPSALLSIAFGGSLGLGMMSLAVLRLNSFGLALFMGTPFVLGLVTAFTLCRRYPASARETLEVVSMTVLLVAGAAFVIGFEGAVCLMMVAPLGLAVAAMGALVGRQLARAGETAARGAVLIAVLLPGTATIEAGEQVAQLREVRSSVVVSASPDDVWREVVAFSPIPEPSGLLFRLGLAYPTHARIEGAGVGAIRYCVFSTGAFVEPITTWEPAVRLGFDVAESPPPLQELTFWEVDPPHLEGYLVAKSGEFRLVGLGDGRTRLEGSTWYEQRLRPEGYWVLFSDYVISRIHRRVLEHIKTQVEGRAAEGLRSAP
ncbi:MAG: DUF805 domain-containing protein [Gemmatimonadota bacterium]|nr:DUF805 domain-containing protein [Gemmatimonadota bacterium]